MKTKVLELEQKVLKFAEFEPLNEVELKETEGGFIPLPLLVYAVPLAVAGLAFYNGYRSTRKES